MPKKAAGVKMSLSEATVKFGIDPRAGQLPTHSEGKDFGKGKGKGGLREFDDSRADTGDWGRAGGKGRRDRNDGSKAETEDWFAKDGSGGGGRSGGGGGGGGFGRSGGDRRQVDDTEADKDGDWRRGGNDNRRGGDRDRGGDRGGGRGSGDAPPTERKRLNLQPRTKPLDNDDRAPARSSTANNPLGAARAREEADSGRQPPWKSKRAEADSKEDQGDDDWNTVPTSSKKTMSTSKTASKMEEAKSSKSLMKDEKKRASRKESSEEEDESDEEQDSDDSSPKKSDQKKASVPPTRAKEQQQRKPEQDREGKARMEEGKKVQKEADKKLTDKDKKKQLKESEKQETREKKEGKKSSKSEKRAQDEEEEVTEDPKQIENKMLAAFEERCESLLTNDADVEELVDEAPSLLPEGSIQTVGPISLLFGRMLRHCHGKNDEEVVALVQRLAPLLTSLINQARVHRFKVMVLCELQRLAHKLGLPRLSAATSLIEAVFDGLYCAEVIEEDYFQIWSINDDDTPGKTDAMFQLSAFLDWLRHAKIEGETSSEEEDDNEGSEEEEQEEEEDSDIESNIPKRPMRR